ncbi:MAG: ABC transporter permease subunit [Candidatus Methanomethylicus sp.]|nr:ABC transporter permease subunit [Candidatus Methanomethylicus sp.]
MTLSNAMLVFWKDWREISRNMQVLGPMLVVPLLFAVVLPAIIFLSPSLMNVPMSQFGNLGSIFESLPADLKALISTMTVQQSMIYVFGLYFFAPFFLIIPLMASSVLAADSFAGEKDRKTLEALLATPLTNRELMLGKILVSFIPSMLVTLLAFTLYCAVVDIASFGTFGGILLLPNALWLALIFGVTPTVALAAIGITVIVSSRVKGFREAQQLSAILVFPILGLIFAQIGGVVFFGPLMLIGLVIGFSALDVVVFWIGVKLFRREEILMRSV